MQNTIRKQRKKPIIYCFKDICYFVIDEKPLKFNYKNGEKILILD